MSEVKLLRAQTPTPITPLILDTGVEIPVVVRHSRRATRIAIRLQIDKPAVELVLPQAASLASGLRFLESRRAWAACRMAQLPATTPFAPDSIIPVLGVSRLLRAIGRGTGKTAPFRLTPTTIDVTGDLSFISRRTHHGLVTLARELVLNKSKALALQINQQIGRVSVGDARTRWGSCSASRDLRFSWRLVMAPESVLNYVVAHEVAHLAQMNHSPAFWKIVADLHPNYAADRGWLRKNGNNLLRYGR